MKMRRYDEVNFSNLEPMIAASRLESEIFNKDDPDEIANILLEDLSMFTDILAPEKLVQMKNRNKSFWSDKTKKLDHDIKIQNSVAHSTNDPEDYRELKHLKNRLTKSIEKDKKDLIYRSFKEINGKH